MIDRHMKQMLEAKCGSLETAWMKYFDANQAELLPMKSREEMAKGLSLRGVADRSQVVAHYTDIPHTRPIVVIPITETSILYLS